MNHPLELADETLVRIVEWANNRDDVHAVILLGSQARTEHKADQWSDIDVVLLVDDPDRYLGSSGWLDDLGSPLVTTVEPWALGGGQERRVLFRSGMDVDFAFVDAAVAPYLVAMTDEPPVQKILGRGFRVLVDKTDFIKATLDGLSYSEPLVERPSRVEFENVSNDFWYHVILAAKKLRRGEVWVARDMCDCRLKKLVVEMLAWKTKSTNPAVDTWHEGRFLEEWADPQLLEELRGACAGYHGDDVEIALRSTSELFARLEVDCALLLGYPITVSHSELGSKLNLILDRSIGTG
jgi:aminoglycoside 6-adenylyltransferase